MSPRSDGESTVGGLLVCEVLTRDSWMAGRIWRRRGSTWLLGDGRGDTNDKIRSGDPDCQQVRPHTARAAVGTLLAASCAVTHTSWLPGGWKDGDIDDTDRRGGKDGVWRI